jgi:hypothetical protein
MCLWLIVWFIYWLIYWFIDRSIDWLIDWLRFYVPRKNFSLIWRRHHLRWKAANIRSYARRSTLTGSAQIIWKLLWFPSIHHTYSCFCVKEHLMEYGSWLYWVVPSPWNRKYSNIWKTVEIPTPKRYLFFFSPVSSTMWWYVSHDCIRLSRPTFNRNCPDISLSVGIPTPISYVQPREWAPLRVTWKYLLWPKTKIKCIHREHFKYSPRWIRWTIWPLDFLFVLFSEQIEKKLQSCNVYSGRLCRNSFSCV